MSFPVASEAVRRGFNERLWDQIEDYQRYFQNQIRNYRRARLMILVTAGAVPVLTAIDGVPKWVLGVLGAIAALTESLNQLYRWRDSAIAAQRAANELEGLSDLYNNVCPPYNLDTDRRFIKFVLDVAKARGHVGDTFANMWAEDKPPTGQDGPSAGQEPDQSEAPGSQRAG